MQNEGILQILLILTYLAIGLLSVTFPIYAISVNYLPQEKWESEKERKKRIDKLRTRIFELTSELKGEKGEVGKIETERITQLKDQIAKYESELKATELGIKYLTAKGAVGIPVIALVLAMTTAVVGIQILSLEYVQWAMICSATSGTFSAVAVYRLYKTISAVELAALRPARSVEFVIDFEPSSQEYIQFKLKEKSRLSIKAHSAEADVKNFVMYAHIPNEIKMETIKSHQTRGSYYEDHYVLYTERTFLPKKGSVMVGGFVTPTKIGESTILVRVCAEGISESKKTLTVNVIE
jgi:hypothetical protein